MEGDFKKNLSLSSPKFSSSVNDENESENHRNSSQKGAKSKNFMAPTISASSKKKILGEWNENSPNTHNKKSPNLGSKSTSNKMGVSNFGSRKSLPKIPQFSSPEMVLKPDSTCDESSSSDKPYDPLTNYLSPRPRFLRYNPDRRRGVLLDGEENCDSISPMGSVDSQNSSVNSTVESSFIEDQVVVEENEDVEEEEEEEEEDDDEEEVIEERKWSFKWELLKSLMVFAVLVVSSRYISSMNSNLSLLSTSIYQDFGNRTSGVVSLRGSEFADWFFVGGEEEESKMGMFEIDGICADLMGCNVAQENEIVEKMEPISECCKDENVVLDSKSMDELVESEASMIASQDENLVNFIGKLGDSEPESEMSYEGIGENVDDCEPISQDGLENEKEVIFEGIEQENVDNVKGIVDFEPKSKDGQSENELEMADEEVDVENEHNQVLETSKNVVVLLILSVMSLVSSFLVKFYFNCKKVSSKAVLSCVKVCSQPEKNSLKLPPKVGKKLDSIQRDDSCLNPLSVSSSREERVEITPPRVIPKVKVLSEFAVEGDFTCSLNRCGMQSKMQENEERIVLRNKESQSGIASSHLQSCISQEKTTNENVKEETMSKATPTPLRRSSRLRNRGVTSP